MYISASEMSQCGNAISPPTDPVTHTSSNTDVEESEEMWCYCNFPSFGNIAIRSVLFSGFSLNVYPLEAHPGESGAVLLVASFLT